MPKRFQFAIATLTATMALLSLKPTPPVLAQIAADGTLSTTVNSSDSLNFVIDNGSRSGGNLFHSFREFSVPTGGSAHFNNAADIQTIFGRVTGSSASNIDGMIRANGTASLFLLNPNGILFGPNAALNLGGSFVGSTANSIRFADGSVFSAVNPAASSLLTVSAPVGLQLGANAGPIQLQGPTPNPSVFHGLQVAPGQTLALVGSTLDLAQANLYAPDGQVELWAVRNADIMIDPTGWYLAGTEPATTDWGTATLRQLSSVDVGRRFDSPDFFSSYDGGSIQVRARGLTLQDGSSLLSSTNGRVSEDTITINTTEFVELLAASSSLHSPTAGISTVAYGDGARGANILVETPQLRVRNGAWIQSSVSSPFNPATFQPISSNNSRSGDIVIRAQDVEIIGATTFRSPFLPPDAPMDSPGNLLPSAITTVLVSPGTNVTSGNISVTAERVRLLEGGRISTDLVALNAPGFTLVPTGRTGDITIEASEILEIEGVTPRGMVAAVISSVQPGAEGQGGNVTVRNTGQLVLRNGGTISTTMAGSGTAGNVVIQARDIQVSDPVIDVVSRTVGGITATLGERGRGQGGSIDIRAARLQVFNGGQVLASSLGLGKAGSVILNVADIRVSGQAPVVRTGQILPSTIGASSVSEFAAGSVDITTDALRVENGAILSVSNSGSGDAGNLIVNSRNIILVDKANLRAEVNGGGQGNIQLTANEVILLRQGSTITTNAQGTSTGGNITANAAFIVGIPSENSDIIANAFEGAGGNIDITAQGIIGLQYRNTLTPRLDPTNDITASSQFSLNGTVQINNLALDPVSSLSALPTDVLDSSQQVAQTCSNTQSSQFVATGRGGIPENPTQGIGADRTWSDLRQLPTNSASVLENTPISSTPLHLEDAVIEATNLSVNAQGQLQLIAQTETSVQHRAPATCSAAAVS
ncbi:filamentous hemagglutinin N-terminal domain-containing protein [Leptolyngbya sp. AN02str]|uniref:filamentous hemagglutinin N-terminal domain-containing protein n=1 Tax=Leptolyngbya sp. AN02str TaxID=3423363 RepID=UPI003D3140F9